MQASGIYSVDTTQVRDAAQAFLRGDIAMDPAASEIPAILPVWGDSLINCCLVSALIIAFIILLQQFVEIFPYIFGGMLRSKPVMNLENNVRLGRERNQLAALAIMTIAVIFARFDVISLRFMEKFTYGISTLLVTGMILAALLVRRIMVKSFEPKRRTKEYYRAANNLFYNFCILLATLMATTIAICILSEANELIVRKILLYEIMGIGILFSLRKIEISSNFCNLLVGFLYLCALEIFPAGLLVAASFLF